MRRTVAVLLDEFAEGAIQVCELFVEFGCQLRFSSSLMAVVKLCGTGASPS
jgi:hypothetical protein